jgi:hypothetical protein
MRVVAISPLVDPNRLPVWGAMKTPTLIDRLSRALGRDTLMSCRSPPWRVERRAAAEKLPVGRALLPVPCVLDGQECPSYW